MSNLRKLLNIASLIGLFAIAPAVVGQSLDAGQPINSNLLSSEQIEMAKQRVGAQSATLPLGSKSTRTSPLSPRALPPKPTEPTPGFSPTPGFLPQENLRPFAENLFSAATPGFVAPSDLPVPADYVIGVGDIIELRLFGKENKLLQLQVERNGVVTLPDIGTVSVAGMTFEAMGKLLLERIAKQKIGVEATVSMGPLRSIQVFLMGDVHNPGAYTTDALTTVTNTLLIGGGIKSTGSMRRIEIRRQGRVVSHVDLYDVMLKGSDRGELRLQSGDTIFVPAVGKRVGIAGDVLRPAIYELVSEKSTEDLVKLAGGLLPTAYPAKAKLDRVGLDGRRQSLDLTLATPEQRSRFDLHDGDVLNIPSVVARWNKSIALAGTVERPGVYEWKQNIHLGMLLNNFDQLARGAYRPLALIERTDEATGIRSFQTVNLLNVIRRQQVIPLQPDDRVIVLSLDDVEFLSSASVQQVLAERLPTVVNQRSSSTLVFGKADRKKLEEANATARSLDVGGAHPQNAAAGLDVKSQTTSALDACRGLIELSSVIASEGIARFRSALFSGSVESDGAHLVKTLPCPAVFDETPTLLPYVLEHSVTLRGELKQPGVLPIPPDMPLDTAIAARGGTTLEADLNGIEISQLMTTARGQAKVQRRLVDKNARQAEIILQPGNVVLVRKRATDQERGLVKLTGEFVHPGNYEIRRGEKLSEVIARAGGLTPQAYPYGTVFLRERIREEKKQYYAKAAAEMQSGLIFAMTRQKSASTNEAGSAGGSTVVLDMINQLKNIDPVGRMVVEADSTVLQVRPELDVMLEANDEIHVPRRPSSILVMGEVLNPGAVQFQAGKRAADYIRAVGGTTRLADENRIFAILPNGSAEPLKVSSWNFQPTLLPPGSVIYVSREPLPTTNTDLMLISLQVIKDLALSAASISVISK